MPTSAPHPRENDDLERRRTAALDLADALRRANIVVTSVDATAQQLASAAVAVRGAIDGLGDVVRPLTEVSPFDDLAEGKRFFSPVIGAGNPMAPPLTFETTPEGVEARGAFDRRFEGPPGFVHGGISALIFDELLGTAMARAGRWGMTAQLTVDYRRALPLDTELTMKAAVSSTEGRKTWIEGSIAVSSQPDVVFATASALFIQPRQATREQYFGSLVDANGASLTDDLTKRLMD
ncbi:PaaI family thioesterase [Subtercola endophyticus]|uniref:PaaI family thioesterase n=1 Tax=Subtercola endophyticus TaxID=2895559 RepID=UPI001E4DEEEA|nr:PaaI family thioesterase [Subtercola endophyticus]UFS58133.1 PaaI family thioesterase [Subtercola endophyticus]